MKIVLVVLLILVLAALASGGLFMLRKGSNPKERDARMARALALRVALSIGLFLLIMLSRKMGWIAPTGLPTGR